MKLSRENIVKKKLFFSPENVLINGVVNKSIDSEKTGSLLRYLKGLQDEGLVELFIILGLSEEKAMKKISSRGLEEYFKKENIFVVTKEYIDSKEEIDRERHLASLEKDPFFVDHFFKQRVLMDLIAEGRIKREEVVLIGHDIWFDGFYSIRYSGVDFILVEKSLSERNNPLPEKIQGLNYLSMNEPDFKKLLIGKFPNQNLQYLENYTFNKLKTELFKGTKIDSLVKKSVFGKKPD